jgi:aryl-alcohol dehydrogenase-like predicted oxidoreductase
MSKLALGTAQFGLPYGVANSSGEKSSRSDVAKILRLARRLNCTALDTAIAYGDSEAVLGENVLDNFNVTTKLPEFDAKTGLTAREWVRTSIEGSLNRLRVSKVHSILLHRPEQLFAEHGGEIFSTLTAMKNEGIVEKLGVSIYSPAELPPLFNEFDFDVVQAPYNVFDCRLETSGWMSLLKDRGIVLQVRSVFLQGLLLMDKYTRPQKFSRWDREFSVWEDQVRSSGQTAQEACLRFALDNPYIDNVIVGVETYQQFRELVSAARSGVATKIKSICCDDIELIDPRYWSEL